MRSRLSLTAAAVVALAASITAPSALGYALIGGAWPSGKVTMQLQLDATAPLSPSLPLTDGSANWNAVAISAMTEWNSNLSRSTFDWTTSTSTAAKQSDNVNNVFFSSTVYGYAFDSNVLAVTLVDHYDDDGYPIVRTHEADLVVNSNRTWNAYRGLISSSPLDLRRVLLHELGHVLGLDHPDQATPAQNVSAIMNSVVSNLELLQADDKAGATYLYSTPLPKLAITQQPTSKTIAVAGKTALTITVDGVNAPAALTSLTNYRWYFKGKGATKFERLWTGDAATLDFGSAQLADAGTYYLEMSTPDTTVDSNQVTVDVTPVSTSAATTLANLSTRGIAGSGSSTMIVGFVVTGSKSKTVLLRSVGPTLSKFGLTGTLGDPKLTLITKDGTTVATSATVWDQSTNVSDIRSTATRVGWL